MCVLKGMPLALRAELVLVAAAQTSSWRGARAEAARRPRLQQQLPRPWHRCPSPLLSCSLPAMHALQCLTSVSLRAAAHMAATV